MNILGKILVFLNLLFALVVGGFLLIDFQTRVNWRTGFNSLEKELKVARQNHEATGKTLIAQAKKIDELEQQLAEEQKKREDVDSGAANVIDKLRVQLKQAEHGAKQAALTAKVYQEQVARFEKENQNLVQLVDARDKKLLETELDKDKYYQDMQQALNERDIALSRMASLQKSLQEMALKNAESQVVKNGTNGTKGSPGPNPPPFLIKGLIEKVDKDDNSLVQISLGSDHGIKVGHTLEAFRRAPAAKYLGMIQIMEVTAHKAVGRLVPSPYAPAVHLKTGDEVASEISSRY